MTSSVSAFSSLSDRCGLTGGVCLAASVDREKLPRLAKENPGQRTHLASFGNRFPESDDWGAPAESVEPCGPGRAETSRCYRRSVLRRGMSEGCSRTDSWR